MTTTTLASHDLEPNTPYRVTYRGETVVLHFEWKYFTSDGIHTFRRWCHHDTGAWFGNGWIERDATRIEGV